MLTFMKLLRADTGKVVRLDRAFDVRLFGVMGALYLSSITAFSGSVYMSISTYPQNLKGFHNDSEINMNFSDVEHRITP
jgi:hypothetical protein